MWYVDENRDPVDLDAVRGEDGLATLDVWLVVLSGGIPLRMRWVREGYPIRQYDVDEAKRRVSEEPVPEEPETLPVGGGGGTGGVTPDQITNLDGRVDALEAAPVIPDPSAAVDGSSLVVQGGVMVWVAPPG